MCNIPTNRQLVFDNQKYEISNSFYQLLIAKTNGKNFNSCKSIVRYEVENASKIELTKVREFKRKNIDFEI